MSKKLLALLCVLAFILSFGTGALASPEPPAGGASSEAPAEAPADRPAPEVVEGSRYVTDYLPGASAVYLSGVDKTFDNTYFYGVGYSTAQEITAEVSSQYGHGAVVLAAGQGTDVTLNNPTIVADPQSRGNGVFASAMAKATVNGGTIDTNCTSGHGIDVTYLGCVYAYDTVIHTGGTASGAIASDYGGGFVYGERLDCTTDGMMSPGIFCAGSSVFMMRDCSFQVNNGNGVVAGMSGSVVVLDNCSINCTTECLAGMMYSGTGGSTDVYAFNSTLESKTGSVIGSSMGYNEMNLVGVTAIPGSANVISCSSGTLTLNVWDTELTGGISCASGTLTINLYSGAKLTGEVTGSGTVAINVYDGGEYVGSFSAAKAGAGEAAPKCGTFTDYLSGWTQGSLIWDEDTVTNYVTNVEPEIIANSAAVYVETGASSVLYNAETFDPTVFGAAASAAGSGEASGSEEASGEASGSASGEASDAASGEADAATAATVEAGEASGEASGSEEASGEASDTASGEADAATAATVEAEEASGEASGSGEAS